MRRRKNKRSNRSSRGFYRKQQHLMKQFTEDMKGFLITSQVNREKSAVKESLNILDVYTDIAYPDLEEVKDRANYEHELKKQQEEKSKEEEKAKEEKAK